MELNNQTEHKFTNIESEEFRVYEFESGRQINIQAPQYLSVSESGGHRILDADGVSHYVPSGWIWLRWKAKQGRPHFVK